MKWFHCIQLAIVLILFPFFLPANALVFPRRDDQVSVYNINTDRVVQAPLSRYHNTYGRTSHLSNLYLRDNSTEEDYDSPSSHGYLSTFMSVSYYVDTYVGNQLLSLFIDTGSSDTWVASDELKCIGWNGFYSEFKPPEQCGFGELFNQDDSLTFRTINPINDSFKVAYADWSSASGFIGEDLITVSNITVNQTFGVAQSAIWKGDNYTSGVLGLGYPGTLSIDPGHSAYEWTSDGLDSVSPKFDCHPVYNTFIENLAIQGYDPVFSVALNRTESDHKPGMKKGEQDHAGVIYFGGTPDLPDLGLPFATVPLNPDLDESDNCLSDPRRIGYKIEIDGFYWPNGTATYSKETAIIDTGASYNLYPWYAVHVLMKEYPPLGPSLSRHGGVARAPCNSTPPEFGIIIDGVVFMIEPQDMLQHILYTTQENEDNVTCSCGFGQAPYKGDMVLGDPFLRNVLAVYDLGKKEMRFAKRFY